MDNKDLGAETCSRASMEPAKRSLHPTGIDQGESEPDWLLANVDPVEWERHLDAVWAEMQRKEGA